MTPSDPKPPKRIRDPELLRRYRISRLYDPCDLCEQRLGIHVHHRKFRSQSGGDVESNLWWLCRTCHDAQHGIRTFEA